MQPDLSLPSCFRLVLLHWRENPISKRVWKKISPYVMAAALVRALFIALSALQQGSAMAPGGPGAAVPFRWQLMALYGGVCCMSLLMFAIWAGGPILFTNQMYRATWLNDEMLRTAAVGKTDRVMGLIAPFMVAIGVYFLPTIVGQPILSALSFISMKQSAGMSLYGGPYSLALTAFSTCFSTVAFIVGGAMMAATVILRLLLLDSWTGLPMQRTWTSVLIPYAIQVGMQFGLGIVVTLPMIIQGIAVGLSVAMAGGGPIEVPWFVSVLSAIWMIGTSFGAVFLMHFVYRKLWTGDIALARTILFDSSRPVVTASSPFAPPPAPQAWQ